MKSIPELFNFDDIGGKIKALAKWSCWIGILLTWISAVIIFLILLFTEGYFFIAFLTPILAIGESFLIWIGTWGIYAFGELVEKVSENENHSKQILFQLTRNDTHAEPETTATADTDPQGNTPVVDTPVVDAPVVDKPAADNKITDSFWICGKCNTKNLNTRADCWSCGNPK